MVQILFTCKYSCHHLWPGDDLTSDFHFCGYTICLSGGKKSCEQERIVTAPAHDFLQCKCVITKGVSPIAKILFKAVGKSGDPLCPEINMSP